MRTGQCYSCNKNVVTVPMLVNLVGRTDKTDGPVEHLLRTVDKFKLAFCSNERGVTMMDAELIRSGSIDNVLYLLYLG